MKKARRCRQISRRAADLLQRDNRAVLFRKNSSKPEETGCHARKSASHDSEARAAQTARRGQPACAAEFVDPATARGVDRRGGLLPRGESRIRPRPRSRGLARRGSRGRREAHAAVESGPGLTRRLTSELLTTPAAQVVSLRRMTAPTPDVLALLDGHARRRRDHGRSRAHHCVQSRPRRRCSAIAPPMHWDATSRC